LHGSNNYQEYSMRLWNVGLLILIWIGTSCRTGRNPYSNREITKEELGYHVAYLASDTLRGRLAGSPEADRAADYIAGELAAYGFAPMGEGGSFFQPFEIVTELRTGKASSLTVAGTALAPEKDFVLLSSSSDTTARGLAVFAGYGIEAPPLKYDDYANVDVKGRIVLVLRSTPEGDTPHSAFYSHGPIRRKVGTAASKGAKGILVFSGKELRDEELVPLTYDNTLSNYGIPAMSVSRSVAMSILGLSSEAELDKLEDKLRNTKRTGSHVTDSEVELRSELEVVRRTTRNVIGLLPGGDPVLKEEVIVIGAHYDHLGMGGSNSMYRGEPAIHNGADDNASGVSTLLEIAQKLSTERKNLRRSVLAIAFSAEEMGTLGSRFFLDHPTLESKRMVTMVNFDMVGRMKEDQLVVHGTGTSPGFTDILTRANGAYGLKLTMLKDGNGPSDFSEFYRKDVPVIAFFTDIHEDYHKPTDDADKINLDGQLKISQLAREVIMGLTSDSVKPAFTRVKGDSMQTPRGFSATLGIVPGYASSEDGLKVEDVNPGQAADLAGIRKGDLIVRFGSKVVKNVYDYTYALGDYRPGDKVKVVVRRDGQEVTLEATLQRSKRR
jgi:hypothetical protein